IIAALCVAHAAGFALLITRPPLHNAPLRLSEVARQLGGGEAAFAPFGAPVPPDFRGAPDGPPPGSPPADAARAPPGERADGPGSPRDPRSTGDRPPGFGDSMAGRNVRGFPVRREWTVHDALAPPAAPASYDHELSDRLAALLARRMGVTRDRVVVYV